MGIDLNSANFFAYVYIFPPETARTADNAEQKAHYPKNRRENGAGVFQWTLCEAKRVTRTTLFEDINLALCNVCIFLHGLDCLMDKGKLTQAKHQQKQRIISAAHLHVQGHQNTYPDWAFRSTA